MVEALLDSQLQPLSFRTGITARLVVPAKGGAVRLANVVGVVPGRSTELAGESVVVGAHFDGIGVGFPAADDNASGTAVLLELARTAVHAGLAPARSLVFAAFNAADLGAAARVMWAGLKPLARGEVEIPPRPAPW